MKKFLQESVIGLVVLGFFIIVLLASMGIYYGLGWLTGWVIITLLGESAILVLNSPLTYPVFTVENLPIVMGFLMVGFKLILVILSPRQPVNQDTPKS